MAGELTLAEELYLASLQSDGRVAGKVSESLKFGLAGGLLLELAAAGRIEAEGRVIRVRDSAPTGEPLLDPALEAIARSKRERSAKHWVNKLGRSLGVERAVGASLAERGLVETTSHKVLGLIPRTRQVPTGDEPVAIRRRVEAALGGQSADPRTALLVGLVFATNLLDAMLPRDRRRDARRRAGELARDDEIGRAVGAAVRAVEAATAAAVAGAAAASVGNGGSGHDRGGS